MSGRIASRLAVVGVVALVAFGGAAWILTHGKPAKVQGPPGLPDGRLRLLETGDGRVLYLSLDDIRRSGETAEATVLTVGVAPGTPAFAVRRDLFDCGGKTIRPGRTAWFDTAGHAAAGEETFIDDDRPATAADAAFPVLCASPPPAPGPVVTDYRATLP